MRKLLNVITASTVCILFAPYSFSATMVCFNKNPSTQVSIPGVTIPPGCGCICVDPANADMAAFKQKMGNSFPATACAKNVKICKLNLPVKTNPSGNQPQPTAPTSTPAPDSGPSSYDWSNPPTPLDM